MSRDSVKAIVGLLVLALLLVRAGGTAERVAIVTVWTVISAFQWWWKRRRPN